MNRLDRTIDQLCRAVLSGDTIGVDAMAREILDARKPKRRPARKHLAPGKTKGERKAAELAHWCEVKAKVRARVEAERQGRCEWGCERPAQDPHHLLGGGQRRAEEAPETVAGICREDHRGYEAADPDVLRRAWVWAMERRFRPALREIEHRMSKAMEARASARRAS